MADGITNIAGIEIPSADPAFLTGVGTHILLGLACVITGAIAMLSEKRAGRHPRNGTIHFWCLAGVFATMTGTGRSALGPEPLPVYPGRIIVRRGLFRPPCETVPLAWLGKTARRRRTSALRATSGRSLTTHQAKTARGMARAPAA